MRNGIDQPQPVKGSRREMWANACRVKAGFNSSLFESELSSFLDRRQFLRLGATWTAVGSRFGQASSSTGYRVGVGRDSSPYRATQRAIDASGEWKALDLAGKTLVVKPNLVVATSEPHVITHPEVTRAVVDRALSDEVGEIKIVETSPKGAHFNENGYGFFREYDAGGRIELIDLGQQKDVLAPVPAGLAAYSNIWTPQIIARSDVVFISLAKLKTHQESIVSLTNKNLFGLPSVGRYISEEDPVFSRLGGRFAIHDRGLHQAIADINAMRPTHFAVIDGSWGMEGQGPLTGNPVQMNTVIAGPNAVAVDRVGMAAIEIPDAVCLHLAYASYKGLGPASLTEVDVGGDPLETRPFQSPVAPPIFLPPILTPTVLAPGHSNTMIFTRFYTPAVRGVYAIRALNNNPHMKKLRVISQPSYVGAGVDQTEWDGRDENGRILPAGIYGILVRGWHAAVKAYRHSNAIGWVAVK